DAVYQAFYDDAAARGFLHSHSYTGNPLACRAALATLELFERLDTLNANRSLARALDEAFLPLTRDTRIAHPRRLGMLWAWDVRDAQPGFAARFHGHAMARGLLMRPIGNSIYAMPPYVLQADEVQHFGQAAFAAFEAALQEEQ
ncbi:MAG TPA: aminotransferase class III-fold pyridoxal phosphate-dependent enzyme, partial [Rhodocyclaceae bacterium]|nr:aminotransferase class III-fold pyridoxal phosphate-dependent enzyme [Rhodocyclaceae bacterium]